MCWMGGNNVVFPLRLPRRHCVRSCVHSHIYMCVCMYVYSYNTEMGRVIPKQKRRPEQ